MAFLGLFNVERANCGVHTLSILLCLHDQITLLVHKPVKTLVLFHLQDENVSGLLGLTELSAKLTRIITSLHAQIIKLTLFVRKRLAEVVELPIERGVLCANALQLSTILLLLHPQVVCDL